MKHDDPHLTSERDDWATPSWLAREVDAFFDPISLDPCWNPASPVRAVCCYQLPSQDGLVLPWFGRVYCNPPYGETIERWAAKIASVGQHPDKVEILALLPIRSAARWWQAHVATNAARCNIGRRLNFDDGNDSAPFPSALCYWGDHARRFAQFWSRFGEIVRPFQD